ncbi:MAG: rubrerythrin family protein [Treponema sp.]|nr:rubrerythrin family protein [Treponema sp.]
MKDLKGTKTEANLRFAFAGESQARGRYFYFAAKAREEGHDAVAHFFEKTAVNEQEHAKLWFKYLGGIGTTKDNLQAAIDGEVGESTEMYPSFAKTAQEEGFDEIGQMFLKVAEIEKVHADTYRKLLGKLGTSTVVQDSWACENCGNVINAKAAPVTCPVCGNADIGWSGYKAYRQVTS